MNFQHRTFNIQRLSKGAGRIALCGMAVVAAVICLAAEKVDMGWLQIGPEKFLRGLDIPSLPLRNKEYARYAGLRYGSGQNDVVYLVFDCEDKLKQHDRLFIYVPGNARYGKPVRFRGKEKNNRCRFSTIKLSADWGKMHFDCSMDISSEMLWDDLKMNVNLSCECRLTEKATLKKCAFDLKGKINPEQNEARNIEVLPLLQLPELKGRWDRRSDPPHIRGRIIMGQFSMTPSQNMSSRAKVSVNVRGNPKSLLSKQFKMKPSGSYMEFTYYADKRFRKETEYDMKLSVDLSPFLGTVTAKDNMVLR